MAANTAFSPPCPIHLGRSTSCEEREGRASLAGQRKYAWFWLYVVYHGEGKLKLILQGPVPQKTVKFNPGLSQILSKVFLPENIQLELTK